MLTPDQFMASQKAGFEALNDLTFRAFEGVEKLINLNLEATKSSLADSNEHAQALFSAKDMQELLALQSEMMQPLANKFAQYGRDVYEIMTGTSNEFGKAFEAKVAENRSQFSNLIEGAVKNAPAGSEAAASMMKSAVAAANNAFDSMQKVIKQASDVAEANFNAAAASATKVTKTATATGKKR